MRLVQWFKKMFEPVVLVTHTPIGELLELPKYATNGSAGVDLRAAISTDFVVLKSKDKMIIPTGLKVALPEGYEFQIRPRSGLAAKYGITILNAPGTIDSDYRGEIQVILYNSSHNDFRIEFGDRIGQMVLSPTYKFKWCNVKNLTTTMRDRNGFGSTGIQ